jgi:hypothetical protein
MEGCHRCGSAQQWVKCWNCGGKGELSVMGDFVVCDICGGSGGENKCLNNECVTNKVSVSELTEDDIWYMRRVVEGNDNAGYLVEARSGKGRTYHNKDFVNGKVQVFLDDGRKMLCDPKTLKLKGFID